VRDARGHRRDRGRWFGQDVLLLTDGRFSGGTTDLSLGYEATHGGPIALVRDGDPIVLDMDRRELNLQIDAE